MHSIPLVQDPTEIFRTNFRKISAISLLESLFFSDGTWAKN